MTAPAAVLELATASVQAVTTARIPARGRLAQMVRALL
jgi:hypothetical protein